MGDDLNKQRMSGDHIKADDTMVDIDKIGTFVRAAETLNFSEAAKQLHMSQPTVSHHIKLLELEMGAVLFVRTNTGLELTEAGKV